MDSRYIHTYIGQTENSFKTRFRNHASLLGTINTNILKELSKCIYICNMYVFCAYLKLYRSRGNSSCLCAKSDVPGGSVSRASTGSPVFVEGRS